MPVSKTNISWADISANHWVGCAKVSEGCKFCWAAEMADRYDRTPLPWTVLNIDDNLVVYDEDIDDLLGKHPANHPSWVFVPSSSDPYLPWVPDAARDEFYDAVCAHDEHCFQVLTKWGPETDDAPEPDWPEHVMLGVTVETPRREYRLDWLREQEAATKFVSFEPLIERIENPDLSGIDWAIIGGETYRDADLRRDMEPEWAIHLIDNCIAQGTEPFFKQHSGPYAEAKTTIGMFEDGLLVEKEVHEFPDVPGGLPAAPREFLDG